MQLFLTKLENIEEDSTKNYIYGLSLENLLKKEISSENEILVWDRCFSM